MCVIAVKNMMNDLPTREEVKERFVAWPDDSMSWPEIPVARAYADGILMTREEFDSLDRGGPRPMRDEAMWCFRHSEESIGPLSVKCYKNGYKGDCDVRLGYIYTVEREGLPPSDKLDKGE